MLASVGPARVLALAGVIAVVGLPGVASAQRGRVSVNTVVIAPLDAQIVVGQRLSFMADAFDRGGNVLGSAVFRYTSSDNAIATIDANGFALGVSPGTVDITAITGTGAAAKRDVATLRVVAGQGPVVDQGVRRDEVRQPPRTIVPPPRSGAAVGPGFFAMERQPDGSGPAIAIVVTPLRMTMVRGESMQLAYNSMREDGGNAERVPIVFGVAPGGERLIRVDSVGYIRALGDTGRTQVSVEVQNNARIPPKPVSVEVRADSVRFQRAELWLPPGTTDTLRLVVPNQQDRSLPMRGVDLQFSSSDATKVRIGSPILPIINTVAPGVARIIGESTFYNISIQVHVLRPVTMFAGGPTDSLMLAMNGRQDFSSVRPQAADSQVVSDAPLRWALADTNVAKFDTATRTLRAVRIGETRLSVSAPFSRDSSTTRSWRIRVLAGGLTVSRSRIGLGVGDRAPLTVQMLDDRRQSIGPATNLRWTSSADTIARFVDSAVQGLKVGYARVTARTLWDSTVTTDVYVSGQMLASARLRGRWDLYQFSADSAPRFIPITSDTTTEMEPVFSPDLTRIAYIATPPTAGGTPDLWVANADGTGARRLTNDSATVGSPVFVRPNGEQIVFHSHKGARAQLYIINRDSTGRRQLTSGEAPNTQPDVSPDGRKILFVSLRNRSYHIYEMNLDGTGERRLTTSSRNEDSPRYAPDRLSFYFLRDEGGGAKRIYRQLLADSTGAATALTPVGMNVRTFGLNSDGSMLVLTETTRVPRVGEVTQTQFLNPATGRATLLNLGAIEQLASPTFRPATTASSAAPTSPTAPTSASTPAAPTPTAPTPTAPTSPSPASPSPASPSPTSPPPTSPAIPRTPPPELQR